MRHPNCHSCQLHRTDVKPQYPRKGSLVGTNQWRSKSFEMLDTPLGKNVSYAIFYCQVSCTDYVDIGSTLKLLCMIASTRTIRPAIIFFPSASQGGISCAQVCFQQVMRLYWNVVRENYFLIYGIA